jgi:Skp family chaperone for outer membrane proteins
MTPTFLRPSTPAGGPGTGVHVAQAQRIAFVNTKYILDQMPEYEAAQKELDRFSKQWQKEIDGRWAQIKRLRMRTTPRRSCSPRR